MVDEFDTHKGRVLEVNIFEYQAVNEGSFGALQQRPHLSLFMIHPMKASQAFTATSPSMACGSNKLMP
eukprot:7152097-Ditylum_brightwellii.AAC.3